MARLQAARPPAGAARHGRGAAAQLFHRGARLRRGAQARPDRCQGRQRHLCARPCPALPLRAGTSAEMTMNMPPEPPALAARLRESAAALLGGTDPYQLLRYQDFGGTPSDRAAVSGWLRRVAGRRRRHAAGLRASTAPSWRCCRKWRAAGRRYASRRWPIRASRPSLPSLAFTRRRCRATKTACWGGLRSLLQGAAASGAVLQPDPAEPEHAHHAPGAARDLADIALRYNVPIIEDDAYGMRASRRKPDASLRWRRN